MLNPELLGLDAQQVWCTESAFQHLKSSNIADTKRTAERRLHQLKILPPELRSNTLSDENGSLPIPSVLMWDIERSRRKRKIILFVQLHCLPGGQQCLHANDARGGRYWLPLGKKTVNTEDFQRALILLEKHFDKKIAAFPHGELLHLARKFDDSGPLHLLSYNPKLNLHENQRRNSTASKSQHLKELEAESIHIIREAVAESERPVMLYSVGKDSSVMLHLARKAFYPAPPPFPLLHVDTRWKFQEMYQFRDYMSQTSGMELLVYTNPEAIEKDINPFDHGSALHTDITKTEGLKQALDQHQFDIIFGGARRDEEKSRAKERIFSFRTKTHQWVPKNQRPEIWDLFNTRKNTGESIRVFPLSNWTELDIWQYIHQESIPVVPLYYSKNRPVVERNGMNILVDDARFKLLPGEQIQEKKVRFRTLGCYPLTSAIESKASTIPDIIEELIQTRSSERQGRAIDTDSTASMEKKKQEGYF